MKYNVSIQTVDSYSLETLNIALDKIFQSLGMDLHNPFQDLIKPGMRVFIKPNWVASRWRASCKHTDNLYCIITHPNVIEAVADRVAVALKGSGEIIIADNPSIDADFMELMEFTGIQRLQNKYDVPCNIYDLRPFVCDDLKYYGKRDKMKRQTGDPLGEVEVNMGKNSLFSSVNSSLFYGVFEERDETVQAHTADNQLYTFARSIYDADVLISIPKMKTHQKAGVTLNLKGLVGAVTQKNQLVHWRVGVPEQGGDEYPDQESYEHAMRSKVTHRGAWPGNDTIWRMVVDLYFALRTKKRGYFTVIDGIMAGEGQGPFCATSKHANTLVASNDFLIADIVATKLMGIDPHKIRYLDYLVTKDQIQMNNIRVIRDGIYEDSFLTKNDRYLDFNVPELWKGIKTGVDYGGR